MLCAEVIDVSLGGALVVIERPPAQLDRTTMLDVELRLIASAGWVRLSAQVLRYDRTCGVVALAFHEVGEEIEAALACAALDDVEANFVPKVVLVESDNSRRNRMARVLRCCCCDPVEVATVQDAIEIIECPGAQLAAVVIGGGVAPGDDAEITARVEQSHPQTEVVHLERGASNLDTLRLAAHAAVQRQTK